MSDEDFEKKRTFFMSLKFYPGFGQKHYWWQTSEMWSCSVRQWACSTIPRSKMGFKAFPKTWYSLQVAKCLVPNYCALFLSDWLTVFPKRFIPPPAVYQYTVYGMTTVEPTECFANPLKCEFAPLASRLLLKKSPESTDDMHFPLIYIVHQWKWSYWKVSTVTVDITGPVKWQWRGTR